MNLPQTLTVIGLLFELSSVLYQAKRTFLPFRRPYKEKKEEFIEKELALTIRQKMEQRERNWFFTLLLLVIGLLFQGAAVLML